MSAGLQRTLQESQTVLSLNSLGDVAQLEERNNRTVEVRGSSPLISISRLGCVVVITANIVADYFLAFANEVEDLLTNLKLNKLVYYTQAWHLALFKKPVFEDEIEAWVHGPVLPAVYDTYKHFKWTPIIRYDLKLEEIRQQFSAEQQELLDDIIEVYLPKTTYELEQLTRDEDPWISARAGLAPFEASHNVITHDAMQKFFTGLLMQGNVDGASNIA